MADFQYQPAQGDPLSKLRQAMTALDGQFPHRVPSFLPFPHSCSCFILGGSLMVTVEGIRSYHFPGEKEDYTTDDPSAMDVDIDPLLVGRAHPEAQHSTQRSDLRLFPPPIFSRQGISQNYKYVHPPPGRLKAMIPVFFCSFKANPMSTPTTVVDEKTGEEKTRLINKARWKGFGPTSVSFAEKAVREISFAFVYCLPGERGWSEHVCSSRARRFQPNLLRTSRKGATSTIKPLFSVWER